MDINKGRADLIRSISMVIEETVDHRAKYIYNLIENDTSNYYLSLSSEFGKVTYAKSPEDQLNIKKRVKTSFRRFIRRQLCIDSNQCSDSWLNWFGCQVLSHLPYDLNTRIKVLRGEEIVTFYANTFVNTCMTGRDNRRKIAFYANNSDKVGLAVMDNFIRAFVWNTDEGITVFDRAYPSGNLDSITMFRSWAKEKGYRLRCNAFGLVPNYETVGIENTFEPLHVTAKITENYPYLDTFRFGKFETNLSVILSNDCRFGNLDFVKTNGLYNKSIECHGCKKPIRGYDPIYTGRESLCRDCWNKNYEECRVCLTRFNKLTMTRNQQVAASFEYHECCDYCAAEFLYRKSLELSAVNNKIIF